MSGSEFPVFPGRNGRSSLAPGPIPADLANRLDLVREMVPGYLTRGAVVDTVAAPDIPTAPVLDSAAQNYNLEGGGTFLFVVDEYTGVKVASGAPATLESGRDPATSILSSADRVKIVLAGELAQEVELGAQSTGAAIAAALQAAIRALTPASAVNKQGYAGFLASYVEPTFASTLAVEVTSGDDVEFITLADITGLRKGQSLKINGSPSETVKIIDINYATKTLRVNLFTAGATYAVGAAVDTADDYYKFSTGKFGADMTLEFQDGASENAAVNLKLKAAGGAVAEAGVDNLGTQRVPYEDADFSSPAAATAAEVVVVINRYLTGVIASVSAGKVRLTGRTLGLDGRIRALAGDAVTKLGYSAEEEVGTETEVLLSLDEAEITAILPYIIGGDFIEPIIEDLATTVSVRRRRLRNISGTDLSDGGAQAWLVVSRPSTGG